MIVDDKGNVFENRRRNKVDRRKNPANSIEEKQIVERRRADRRKDPSQEKNKEVNR